jgi:peptidoglycan/xylan/chitin deacetylase (PgdA/CDA1 family)
VKDLGRSLVLAFAACGSDPLGAPGTEGPLSLASVTPAIGSVGGGTRIVLEGANLSDADRVTVGDVPCTNVRAGPAGTLSCMTGNADFREGAVDVVVARDDDRAVLPAAFTYRCLWTTTAGRRSCGAAPPGLVAPQAVAGWFTQFQNPDKYSISSNAPCNLSDTDDHVLGTQSMSFDTDGTGTVATLQHEDMPPIDARDSDFKIWVKIDNVAHLAALDVWLGDSGLRNVYKFRLRSTQAQQWMTDGDWVSFTVPWSPDNYVIEGTPNRAAITELAIRAADDATGNIVRVHLNGIALVPEPVQRYPHGVVSFTFDDGWATAIDPGAQILAAHHVPATAYIIMDAVGLPGRVTLADLHAVQDAGWDVAVHANTDLHHFARFPSLPTPVVEDDVVDARAWLIENGFKGYDHCAYPGGDFSGGSDVLGVAARYFASCRTIFEKQRETYPPSDPHKLRVLLVTNTMTLGTVEQMVDDAQQSREWLILVFHKLGPSTTSSIEWSAERFTALADYITASGMPVETVSSVLAQ